MVRLSYRNQSLTNPRLNVTAMAQGRLEEREAVMRILLVEDDPTTSKSIELMLQNANLNVYATSCSTRGNAFSSCSPLLCG